MRSLVFKVFRLILISLLLIRSTAPMRRDSSDEEQPSGGGNMDWSNSSNAGVPVDNKGKGIVGSPSGAQSTSGSSKTEKYNDSLVGEITKDFRKMSLPKSGSRNVHSDAEATPSNILPNTGVGQGSNSEHFGANPRGPVPIRSSSLRLPTHGPFTVRRDPSGDFFIRFVTPEQDAVVRQYPAGCPIIGYLPPLYPIVGYSDEKYNFIRGTPVGYPFFGYIPSQHPIIGYVYFYRDYLEAQEVYLPANVMPANNQELYPVIGYTVGGRYIIGYTHDNYPIIGFLKTRHPIIITEGTGENITVGDIYYGKSFKDYKAFLNNESNLS